MVPVSVLVSSLLVANVAGFVPLQGPLNQVSLKSRAKVASRASLEEFDPFGFCGDSGPSSSSLDLTLESKSALGSAMLAPLALAALPADAWAKGGEFGLAEGRIISLAHPTIMGVCFLVSLGAAYTGLQWRRIRDLQGEVSELKTQLKAPEAALAKLEAGSEEGLVGADAAKASALKAEIKELTAQVSDKTSTRKDLISMDFRDRHWALGSVLLGLGVSFAIEGPVNTYMRAGKLFPGPHLYAGAGCVCLWALAAALVPQMQKGKDWARSGHIGLNVASTALFAYYQIPTGLEIAAKVIEKTKFP